MSLSQQCQDEFFLNKCLSLSFIELRSEIEQMAEQYHQSFCTRFRSTIYILWADGEITEEIIFKPINPFAYLFAILLNYRYVKPLFPPLFSKPLFIFPYSRYPHTGCILSFEDCILFREWMIRVFIYDNRFNK